MLEKKLKNLTLELDIDLQSIANELDEDGNDLVVISTSFDDLSMYEHDALRRLIADIAKNGIWEGAYDDDIEIYDYENITFAKIVSINYEAIIFSRKFSKKIKGILQRFQQL